MSRPIGIRVIAQAYAHDATSRYPVVYLTNANCVFGITVQTHVLLRMGPHGA
jgi:hypothetical protein